MSWMKENYEKAALGGAALLLVGIGVKCFVLGGDSLSSKEKAATESNEVQNPMLSQLVKVLDDRSKPAAIRAKVEDGREIDLTVGQALYVKNGGSQPVDLYESAPVHEGIKNKWWLDNDLDPGYANAPERDFDKDGFTNREEAAAGTDPKSAEEHPSLLAKLLADNVQVLKMQMRWNVIDENTLTMTYRDTNRVSFRENVKLGSVFFDKEDAYLKQRFKIAGEAVKVPDARTGQDQDAYEVTDLDPRYKGTDREKFFLPRRGTERQGATEIQDRSVTLTLHALGKSGEQFVVNEHEAFSLPYDAAAKKKNYKVASIVPKAEGSDVYTVTITDLDNAAAEPRVLTARKK